MLDARGAFPGFLGRRIRLDGLPVVTLDWLRLRGHDCLATFDSDDLAVTDFLLILTRRQRGIDQENLAWFLKRVVGSFETELSEDSIRHVRDWPAPLAVRFPLNPRHGTDHSINFVEHCFCDAFARVIAAL
jgi:hypothetical protein